METVLASVSFAAAVACCAERLVRGRDVRWAVAPLAVALVAWLWLWSVRLPPTPGRALLAFTLADLAVLGLGVVGVMRLLGAFDTADGSDGDERWREDDQPPLPPWDPPPSTDTWELPPLSRHDVPPRDRRREDHRGRRPTEV